MRTIKKVKTFAGKHYYGLCLFAFLFIYCIVVPTEGRPWIVNDATYSFYAIDFSVGFCSRVIQGALYNLIFRTPDYLTASIYLIGIFIITFGAVSFLAEKFIKTTDAQYRKSAIIITLFFFTGPATFAVLVPIFGMIDIFWVFATALSMLCLQNKKLYFLVVPLAVFMVFVYYGATLCYVPLLAIILLYKISVTEERKEKRYLTAIFFATVALTIFFTVYFVVFERSNLTMTMEEFDKFLVGRGVSEGDLYYYNFSYYRDIDGFEENGFLEVPEFDAGSSPSEVIKVLFQQAWISIFVKEFTYVTFIVALLLLPILVFIYKFLITFFRKARGNNVKRFSLLCAMALFPFVVVAGFCFSTDVVRWIGNAFLPTLALFMYILYKERAWAIELVHRSLNAIGTTTLIPYYLVYSLTVFLPDLS